MAGPAEPVVEIVGLREFSRELRKVGPEWPKHLTRVHRTITTPLAARARANAQGLGGVHAKAAKTIRGKASPTAAAVGPTVLGKHPYANVAFWGRRNRSGWYANIGKGPGLIGKAARALRGQAASTRRPQGPAWVGNSWQAGERGQGPYAINDAVADLAPNYEQQLANAYADLTRRAFPT